MALSEEDLEKLSDVAGKTGTQVEPASDDRCPECQATISQTPTFGEVGHHPQCSRREERYHGRAGRRKLGGGRVIADE